jgi:2-(1,2-epoxy-1,2-dihydrophenyl)acetyl-CoA isomerase
VSDHSIHVERAARHIAVVTFERPPANFFSLEMIGELADTLEAIGADGTTHAVVIRAAGKHFCAGADFTVLDADGERQLIDVEELYRHAARIFAQPVPLVACLHGAVIGGGLGLGLAADFRVAASDARISANFARLGIHQGFGLSVTLPRTVGWAAATRLLYTGQSLNGAEAAGMGLVDLTTTADSVVSASLALAADIASSAPLAVRSIRHTMRGALLEEVRTAISREVREQRLLFATADFGEGVSAARERRQPEFIGR